MKKVNFKKTQLATIGALISIGLFNPMSVEILEDYFKMVYTAIFLVSGAWVIFFVLKKSLTPETNIPSKTAKTSKAGKFVE